MRAAQAPLHLKHKLGLESGGSMFFLDLLCFEGDNGLEIAPFQVRRRLASFQRVTGGSFPDFLDLMNP